MKSLLKLEFTRLRKQKSFYVCSVLAMVFVWLLESITYTAAKNWQDFLVDASGIQSLINGVGTSAYVLLSSVFVVLYFCEDHTQQTIKNILAKGYSKTQVYFAKTISCCGAATLMFVMVELAALVIGTCFYGFGDPGDYSFLSIIGTQYIANMVNILLCIFICALCRKTGASMLVMLFVPDLIDMALSLGELILSHTTHLSANAWFIRLLNDACTLQTVSGRLYECLLGSLVYAPIFLVAGLCIYKKREL